VDDNAWLAAMVLAEISRIPPDIGRRPEDDDTREIDLSRLAAASRFAVDRGD
jgi:hypothetical protein